MSKTTLIVAALALAVTLLAYAKSPQIAWQGASLGARLFIGILPNIMLGFLLGGMVTVLLPRELVAQYAGDQSGWPGLLLATLVGAFTPAGPFVTFPLLAAMWQAGAGVAQLAAYLTAWALLGVHRLLIYELPIMGWRFMAARLLAALVLPLLVGVVTGWLYRLMTPA